MSNNSVPLNQVRKQQAANENGGSSIKKPSRSPYQQSVESRALTDGMFYASSLQGLTPPPREWVVPDLVPDKAVTLFSGNGAIGKSLLALQLAAACACGGSWLGNVVKQRRALYVSAEDDKSENHRRLFKINRSLNRDFADYEQELMLWDKTNNPQPFLFRDRDTWSESDFYCLLEQWITEMYIQFVVVDSMYNFFGGNELNRQDATAFMDSLQRMSLDLECAIMVLWHPSASGLDSGTGTSGSTAFRNRARQMLYMTKPGTDDDDFDPDVRTLKVVKSNYGPNDVEHRLRFGDGYLYPFEDEETGVLAHLKTNARLKRIDEVFLKCLDVAGSRRMLPSPSPNSANYAPRIFASMPECGGIKQKQMTDAMNRLIGDGTIRIGAKRKPNRHLTDCLIRAEDKDEE